jgi:hypothetical protein
MLMAVGMETFLHGICFSNTEALVSGDRVQLQQVILNLIFNATDPHREIFSLYLLTYRDFGVNCAPL